MDGISVSPAFVSNLLRRLVGLAYQDLGPFETVVGAEFFLLDCVAADSAVGELFEAHGD